MHAANILNFFEIKQGYLFIFFFNLLISLYLKKKKNSESYLSAQRNRPYCALKNSRDENKK